MLCESGSAEIVYHSVRRIGGKRATVFRSPLLSNARQEPHFCYIWDRWRIAAVCEKRKVNSDGSA